MKRPLHSLLAVLKSALPPLPLAAFGSLAWAMAMAASAAGTAWARARPFGGSVEAIMLIFALGGLLAFVPAVTLLNMAGSGKSFSQRYALAFLSLSVATIGFTVVIFGLDYRAYYAQWHDAAFSGDWMIEQFFTTASAVYQFAVLGMRFYFPLGVIALFFASSLLAKKPV